MHPYAADYVGSDMKQSYPGAIKSTLAISNQKAEVHTVNVYQNPDLICSFANSP